MSSSPSTSSSGNQDSSEYLRSATFARPPHAPSEVDAPVTASDLLLGAYDPAKLHPLAGLSDKLDYLSLEDDKISDLQGAETVVPSRGWSDDLCYGTGTVYLGGECIPLLFEIAFFCRLYSLVNFSLFLSFLSSQFHHQHITLLLIVLLHHMLTRCLQRFGSWRRMGFAGRGSTPSCRNKFTTSNQQCTKRCDSPRNFHWQFRRSCRFVNHVLLLKTCTSLTTVL